jgi:hypothetical protein
MSITKKSGRQEVISVVQDIYAVDLATTVIGTGTAVSEAVVDIPNKAVIVSGSLTVLEAWDTAGVHAYGVLTSTAAPADTNTVTIGSTVYTFKTTLTASTTAYEVLIGASEAASLTNLTAAINRTASGAGTLYGSLTVAHPNVTAVTDGVHTLTVTSTANSTADDALATTETHANATWGAATLVNFDPPLDSISVKIGGTEYIAATNADVLNTRTALIPTGTVMTADDTLDFYWDTAATSVSAPTVGRAQLIVNYVVTDRAAFSQG